MPRRGRETVRVFQRARASGRGETTQVAGNQINQFFAPGSGPAPSAAASLPAAPAHLVGRQGAADEIISLLDPGRTSFGVATVLAVIGLAGIGKTAVVLDAAYEAVDRGWFPGGVLFADLRGYDPEGPSTGERVIGSWLRALGVGDADLPPTPDEQAALYRSRLAALAEEGRPVLLVADNASDQEQIRPLIPGRGAHRVLVTSRDTVAGISARLIELGQLEPTPAAELITGVLLRARPSDTRPTTEPDALAQLAEQCGGLPLALQIAAEILTADPGLRIAELTDAFTNERSRLVGQPAAGAEVGRLDAVRIAFDVSYGRLDPYPARLFRLLSLSPGPDIATDTAAALVGRSPAQVRTFLAALAEAHLLMEEPVGGNRWRMHDLVHLYAADLAVHATAEPERNAALDRVLEHYRARVDAADDLLRALPGDVVPEHFSDRARALEWLDAERLNVLAAIDLAARSGRERIAVSLVQLLDTYLKWTRRFNEAATVGQMAVDAARSIGDDHGEGGALVLLGSALLGLRRFDEARLAHERSFEVFAAAADRHGQGVALANLATALQELRRFDEAIDVYARAEEIFTELGDRQREAQLLINRANALQELRRFDDAVTAYSQALAVFTELGDRLNEALAVNNRGNALRLLDRTAEAITAHRQALVAYRELGDRHGEGNALTDLGLDLRKNRQFSKSVAAHREAAEIYAELQDRHGEGKALNNRANTLVAWGRHPESIDIFYRAMAICIELDDHHGEAAALTNLGVAFTMVRRFNEAIASHQAAAEIFNTIGDLEREHQALKNLAVARQIGTKDDRLQWYWRRLTWRKFRKRLMPPDRPL